MSAVQQAARILLDEVKYGQMNLSTSFQLARGEALGGSATTTYPTGVRSVYPNWARGSSVNVSETQPDGGNTSPDTPVASGTTGVKLDTPDAAAQRRQDDQYYKYNPK